MSLHHKKTERPQRKFVWLSALSFGTVFSFLTFGIGAGSFDEMMISLGIRSGINTEGVVLFRFGEIYVTTSTISAVNLSEEGVPYRGTTRIVGESEREAVFDTGFFRSPNGVAISDGIYYQAWMVEPEVMAAEETRFCNVTARYKFGIPIYHYAVGATYPSHDPFSVPDSVRKGPEYRTAEEVALSNGWNGVDEVTISFPKPSDFHDSGTTFNWSFCDRYEF